MKPGQRTRLHRLPERGAYDPETVHSILDAGFLAHVGFSVDSQVVVIPTLYARSGQALYLHGSADSRTLRVLATGCAACAWRPARLCQIPGWTLRLQSRST